MLPKLAIASCLLLSITGCATMNKDECVSADWQALGYQQGARGGSTQAFNRMQSACANHGITANFTAYQQGHRQGLDNYCSFDQGLALGQNGSSYNTECSSVRYPAFKEGFVKGVARYCNYDNGFERGAAGKSFHSECHGEAFSEYQRGFDNGEQKYKLGKELNDLKRELDDIDSEIRHYNENINYAKGIITSEQSTAEQRTQALSDLERYQSQLAQAEDAYHATERKIHQLQRRFDGWL